MIRTENKEMVIDFVFRLGHKQTFEKVKANSSKIKIGNFYLRVHSLNDILLAKKQANRPKNRAVLNRKRDFGIRIKQFWNVAKEINLCELCVFASKIITQR